MPRLGLDTARVFIVPWKQPCQVVGWCCQVDGWLFLVIVLVLFLAHCFGLVSLLLFFLLWFVPFVLFFLGVFLLVLLLLAYGYLKVARSPEMSLRERLLTCL